MKSWLSNLELEKIKKDNKYKCDGCGYSFQENEKVISNIDSCCGPYGCYRRLCIRCINYAKELFDDEYGDKNET